MSEERHETIATKISIRAKKQLDRCLAKMKLNYYQWFKWMAEVTVRLFDDRHRLTPQMSKMIQLYQMIPGWNDPTSFIDPNDEPEIEEAIYIMNTKGKHGLKVVKVSRGLMDGEWHMTENVMEIAERCIEATMPQSYTMLRQAMVDLHCSRVFEVLLKLADDATNASYDQEIAEMFSDDERTEWGEQRQHVRTKQRKHVGVEDMQGLFDEATIERERQRREEYERQLQASEEASRWLREHSDFDPHGGEW